MLGRRIYPSRMIAVPTNVVYELLEPTVRIDRPTIVVTPDGREYLVDPSIQLPPDKEEVVK